jgi:hypothetical protein
MKRLLRLLRLLWLKDDRFNDGWQTLIYSTLGGIPRINLPREGAYISSFYYCTLFIVLSWIIAKEFLLLLVFIQLGLSVKHLVVSLWPIGAKSRAKIKVADSNGTTIHDYYNVNNYCYKIKFLPGCMRHRKTNSTVYALTNCPITIALGIYASRYNQELHVQIFILSRA